jgi:hypothetical protein
MPTFARLALASAALAALTAPAVAGDSGWTGWSQFYRSYAIDAPHAVAVKMPGTHKNGDVTMKRGVIGTAPAPANAAPATKHPDFVWLPHGNTSALDDLPAPPKLEARGAEADARRSIPPTLVLKRGKNNGSTPHSPGGQKGGQKFTMFQRNGTPMR